MEFNGVVGRHFRRVRRRDLLIHGTLIAFSLLIVAEAVLATPPSRALAQVVGSQTETHAGVQPNPVNTLYAQLEDRANNLTQQEADIVNREIAVGIAERERSNAVLMYAMFGLLILIAINSVFDFIEVKELRMLERQLRARQ